MIASMTTSRNMKVVLKEDARILTLPAEEMEKLCVRLLVVDIA
jgi:hypothetical protein